MGMVSLSLNSSASGTQASFSRAPLCLLAYAFLPWCLFACAMLDAEEAVLLLPPQSHLVDRI